MWNHSGGILIIDKIQCKVAGLPKEKPTSQAKPVSRPKPTRGDHNQSQSQEQDTQQVRINGISCNSDIAKVKKWLELYGELRSDITEDIIQITISCYSQIITISHYQFLIKNNQ